jgi:hypothetical protein
MKNDYLEAFRNLERLRNGRVVPAAELWPVRLALAGYYSWAIPDEAALQTILEVSGGLVVSVGAGAGYWEALLADRGARVRAFDVVLPGAGNPWTADNRWFPVEPGGPEVLADFPDHALFLCWPPPGESMALECLRRYTGGTVVYVGDGPGGCTADDAFHAELRGLFTPGCVVMIPTWPGCSDRLGVWRRKGR